MKNLKLQDKAIYQIEKGLRIPGIKFIKKTSDVFNVPTTYFFDEDSLVIISSEKLNLLSLIKSVDENEREKVLDFLYKLKGIPIKKIPVLGYIKARESFIVNPENEPIKYLELPYEETKNAEYSLIVKSDSIKGKGIFENDNILLNEKLQVENRDSDVVIINGDATFMIFVIEGGKKNSKTSEL